MSDNNYIEEWGPPWAPHVVGSYEMPRTFDESGMPETQWIEMRCTFAGCNGSHRMPCTSGNVRQHIARFALMHVHRDPLANGARIIPDLA